MTLFAEFGISRGGVGALSVALSPSSSYEKLSPYRIDRDRHFLDSGKRRRQFAVVQSGVKAKRLDGP